jgi:hypothetical protein
MRFDKRCDLPALKMELQIKIDEAAGAVRSLFITTSPGQEMVYMEKRREAEALMANTNLPPAETPHITAEADLSGVDRYEKAVEVITMAYQWAQLSTLIEGRRLAAKEVVRAATSPQSARQAAAVDWSDLLAMAPTS